MSKKLLGTHEVPENAQLQVKGTHSPSNYKFVVADPTSGLVKPSSSAKPVRLTDLQAGTAGQLLYMGSSDWVALNGGSAADGKFLKYSHSSSAPVWEQIQYALAADSGSASTLDDGQTLTINGTSAQGLSSAISGQTYTMTISNATASQKGVAKYRAADFDLSTSAGEARIAAAQTNITSVKSDSLVVGKAAGNDHIDFSAADQIQMKTNNISRLVAKDAGVDITGQLDVVGSVGVSANLVIQGDLVVDGDTIEVVGENVQMKDTLMELGMEDDGADGLRAPTVTTTKDLGMVFHRGGLSGSFSSAPSGISHSNITTSSLDGSTSSIAFSGLSGFSGTIPAGSLLKVSASSQFRVYVTQAAITSSTSAVAVAVDSSTSGQASGSINSYTALDIQSPTGFKDAFFRDQSDGGKFKLMASITESSGVVSGSTFADLKVAGMESSSLAVSAASDLSGSLSLLTSSGVIDQYAGSNPLAGELLIGDASSGNKFSKATLTQGSGMKITNSNGGITLAASASKLSSKLLHCEFNANGVLIDVVKDSASGSSSDLVPAGNSASGAFNHSSSSPVDALSANRDSVELEFDSSHGLTLAKGDIIHVLNGSNGFEYICLGAIGSSSNKVSVQFVCDVGAGSATAITKSSAGDNGVIKKFAKAALGGIAVTGGEMIISLDHANWYGGTDKPGLAYRAEVDRHIPDPTNGQATSSSLEGHMCWNQDSAGIEKKEDRLEIDMTGAGDADVAGQVFVTMRVQVIKYFLETGDA